MPIVTLTTDFGTADFYAGAVKGVLLSRAPGTTIVDLSHEIAAGDIAAASFVLRGAAETFPAGTVHLAVVDPGVGSARRMLIVDHHRQRFVAPDNGLLEPWLAAGDAAVFAVTDTSLFRAGRGETFHGRDRFAPVAAALLAGAEPRQLGIAIDDAVRAPQPLPARTATEIRGRIVHIDRFGNAVTDIPADWLPDGVGFAVHVGARTTHVRASHYAAITTGTAAVLTGSLGLLELSMNGVSLARRWSIERGDAVRFDLEGTPATASDGSVSGTSPPGFDTKTPASR